MKKMITALLVCTILVCTAFAAPSIYSLVDPVAAEVTIVNADGQKETHAYTVETADDSQYSGVIADVIKMSNANTSSWVKEGNLWFYHDEGTSLAGITGYKSPLVAIVSVFAGENSKESVELVENMSMVTGILNVTSNHVPVSVRGDKAVYLLSAKGTAATQGFVKDQLVVIQFSPDGTIHLYKLAAYNSITGDYSVEFENSLDPFLLALK